MCTDALLGDVDRDRLALLAYTVVQQIISSPPCYVLSPKIIPTTTRITSILKDGLSVDRYEFPTPVTSMLSS